MTGEPAGALRGVRVLDLTDQRGALAGRILAALGADVVKVEPPEGSPLRRIPPFDERNGREGESLYWAALGAGMSSLVLDLESEGGRARLRDLARRADVLLESAEPRWMAARGIDADALRALNPRLIVTSITPYGQDGPKAGWAASELTIEAAGGRLSLQGDRDRVPFPIGYPQAAFHAGGAAAADTVIALNERATSGLGQHLDTSMQAAMIWTLMDTTGFPPATGANPPGTGEDRAVFGGQRSGAGRLAPCADGWLSAAFQIWQLGAVMPSVLDEPDIDPRLRQIEWEMWEQIAMSGAVPEALLQSVGHALGLYLQRRTKRELMGWAAETGIRLAPVNTTRDLLDALQLKARGFWEQVDGHAFPGAFAKLSRTPLVPPRPAPAVGEGGETMVASWPAPSTDRALEAASPERLGEAFVGLKVADFSWVAAGPMTARALADHGATVVHVESSTRLDTLRHLPPFLDNIPAPDRGQWVSNMNASKFGLALNLSTVEGRAIARRLADWADVVVESFTPGTMKRFGLDYEALSANRPDLIMFSTCLMGQTGPHASYGGFGTQGSAIAGFQAVTGWPDRPPTGPFGPYSDVILPRFGIPTLAAAILERRTTGLGQHIDIAQVEAAIQFMAPAILDEAVNGRTMGLAGLHSAIACPNTIVRTAGTERFVAVSIETTAHWRALLAAVPSLEVFGGVAFDSLDARRAVAADIDARLAEWAATLPAPEVEARLVNAGVPASMVQRMTDLHADPQLRERRFFVPLEHRVMGVMPYDGLATRFSAKRQPMHRAGPVIGEHTEWVLRDLLGLSDDQIAEAAAADALT
ncbi:MAG: CoA transferase [Dehalococcoidia bacterium]|nr:MAG: CoA transferase [Dehalococcoidia bacterium]